MILSNKLLWSTAFLASAAMASPIPDNLVVEGVPPISSELRADAARYLEFRAAAFQGWHPTQPSMLITTRFADTMQLHQVASAGGARRQLTFLPEPVSGASYRPKSGEFILFSQDTGGGEFFQLYRYDLADARITRLTDGKSRNTGARWSRGGEWLAYSSTRRTGRDTDIWVMNPADPETDRLVGQMNGGGWFVQDWSPDDRKLLVLEYVSINESFLHLLDVNTGEKRLITPKTDEKISHGRARFARDGNSLYVTSDKDSEFMRLVRMNPANGNQTVLTGHIPWDITEFELSPDGQRLAFVANEDGTSVLHLLNVKTGREIAAPKLPMGVIGGLEWHENNRDLGFTLTSARSPADAYSINSQSGKLERWTESETGGLNVERFSEPELVKMKSFDQLPVSAFVYRPDPAKFPGPRPVLISIHGGPESQARPGFLARNNYLINELGIALIYPNVRGSSGYGKTFLTLDNGFRREDSVKDIGTVIDWAVNDPGLDGARIGVTGGSYGGYMVLASLAHFGDRLRAGIDIVGISNFVTFLKNTQDYRRDLRRVEYGDERDPEMREFLERISPTANVKKITKPLFVVQGQNDPRVPVTEAEQMVQAIRENGGSVWYLMARDEGHGFAKKPNADFQFLSTLLFLKEHLLN
jgi:dipeptidyl aminopeptidase/acylaminoacyl peptidase